MAVMVVYLVSCSPEVYRSPTSNAESALFVNLLIDDLKEYAYNAEMAGIEYNITADVYAIQVFLITSPVSC